MLVLSRKKDQSIYVDVPTPDGVKRVVIKLIEIRGDKVRLGFTADKSIAINRDDAGEKKEDR